MGRGQHQRAGERLRLSDSETRVRLEPHRSEREALRKRLRSLVAGNVELNDGNWAGAIADVELEVGEMLPLAEATAVVDELATLTDVQARNVIHFRSHQFDGRSGRFERVHLFGDGGMILRAVDEEAARHLSADLYVPLPLPFPGPDEFDLFAYSSADGGWESLVAGRELPGSREVVGIFLVHAIYGAMPGWDDRDPMWSTANIDVEERLSGRELPLREWFAERGKLGWSVTWERDAAFEVEGVRELIYAFDCYSWSPRRFVDGCDERFGIDGPKVALELSIGLDECLRWVVEEAEVWEIDPALVADAFVVMRKVSGGDWVANDDLESAVAIARDLGNEYGEEALAGIDRFVARLHALLTVGPELAEQVAALPPRLRAES